VVRSRLYLGLLAVPTYSVPSTFIFHLVCSGSESKPCGNRRSRHYTTGIPCCIVVSFLSTSLPLDQQSSCTVNNPHIFTSSTSTHNPLHPTSRMQRPPPPPSTMAVTHRHVSLEPSASPPPQQQPQNLTKRDVRRNRIMERLQGMVDSFASNQQNHYRAQLQAVQVDMTLVLRADPYDGGPLEDGGEEVREMVESMLGAAVAAGGEASKRDYVAMAGKRYAEFAREVNDELEKRDAELVALHVRTKISPHCDV